MNTLYIMLFGSAVAVILSVVILCYTTKKKNAELKELRQLQRKPYEKLAADFARVGWPAWGYTAHCLDGQYDRIQRAINSRQMSLLSYDKESHSAVVQGERGALYKMDAQGCSCPDFAKRGLPCKHMYFAVMEIPEDS